MSKRNKPLKVVAAQTFPPIRHCGKPVAEIVAELLPVVKAAKNVLTLGNQIGGFDGKSWAACDARDEAGRAIEKLRRKIRAYTDGSYLVAELPPDQARLLQALWQQTESFGEWFKKSLDEPLPQALCDSFARTIAAFCPADDSTPGDPHGWASCRELAARYHLSETALSNRLKRWRYNHDEGWTENPSKRKGEPRYLYRESVVQSVVSAKRET